MHFLRKASLLLLTSTLIMGIVSALALAQSGSRGSGVRERPSEPNRPQEVQPSTAAQFQEQLWDYLTAEGSSYQNWATLPGNPEGMYEGQSPHGAFLRLYANAAAVENAEELPYGSVIVKENYGPDQETLMAITVMLRSRDYDAEHYDWYWVKYLPDGSVATTPAEAGGQAIAGRTSSCIECHVGAGGEDYTFSND